MEQHRKSVTTLLPKRSDVEATRRTVYVASGHFTLRGLMIEIGIRKQKKQSMQKKKEFHATVRKTRTSE
jgi:hypothetical protein